MMSPDQTSLIPKFEKDDTSLLESFRVWNILHWGFSDRDTRLLKAVLVSPNPRTSEICSLFYRCSSPTNMRLSFVIKAVSCLELVILLPQPLEHWDHRSVSAHPVSHIHVSIHRYQTHTCQQAKYLSYPSLSFQSQIVAVFVFHCRYTNMGW